jgi:hypothetical protein
MATRSAGKFFTASILGRNFSAQRTQSLPLFDGKEVKRSKEGHQKKEESENKNKNTCDRDMMYMIKRQSRVASS